MAGCHSLIYLRFGNGAIDDPHSTNLCVLFFFFFLLLVMCVPGQDLYFLFSILHGWCICIQGVPIVKMGLFIYLFFAWWSVRIFSAAFLFWSIYWTRQWRWFGSRIFNTQVGPTVDTCYLSIDICFLFFFFLPAVVFFFFIQLTPFLWGILEMGIEGF